MRTVLLCLSVLLSFGCGSRKFTGDGDAGDPDDPNYRSRNLCITYPDEAASYCGLDCSRRDATCPEGSVCILSDYAEVRGRRVQAKQCVAMGSACGALPFDPPFCESCDSHVSCIGEECGGVGFCSNGCDPDDDFVCCSAGDECCTDLLFDEQNCGACGRACEEGEFCFAGSCNPQDL